MDWNVKEDFCEKGITHSLIHGTSYQFFPRLRIDTDAELTEEQKRRIVDALVKSASVEMIHINEEAAK